MGEENQVVLRVAAEETGKCVLQIGTNSSEKAVKICNKLYAQSLMNLLNNDEQFSSNDVAAIGLMI